MTNLPGTKQRTLVVLTLHHRFDEYATSIFVAYILRQLEKVSRLDVLYNGIGMSLSESQKVNR